MEDNITVGVELLLDDGVSDALSGMMKQLAAADQAIAATAANWEGLHYGDGAPVSPAPSMLEKSADSSPESAVPDLEVPDLFVAPRVEQGFAPATAASPPPAPLDEGAPRPEAPPASYAPTPPDMSATGDVWSGSEPQHSVRGFDPVSMVTAVPSSPVDGDFARPTLSSAGGTPPSNAPKVSAAPIPTADPPVIAPPTSRPSNPSWQNPSESAFAALPPAQPASIAPREAEPAAASPSASDLTPSGRNLADAMPTAPLADAGGAEGQLLLDGSLLGRWVIDHLSREADRPPAGGTAFDPRQGR